MKKLIEALTILSKYGDPSRPTHCEHDVLYVSINPKTVSDEDKAKLDDLGFIECDEFDCFQSFRYGSA